MTKEQLNYLIKTYGLFSSETGDYIHDSNPGGLYKCPFCNYSFSQIDYFTSHIETNWCSDNLEKKANQNEPLKETKE